MLLHLMVNYTKFYKLQKEGYVECLFFVLTAENYGIKVSAFLNCLPLLVIYNYIAC